MIDLAPIFLSLRLALVTTILLLVISIPLAYWLAYNRFRMKAFVEAFISMPLVLPPTVIGFYLLLAFSPSYWFGAFLQEQFNLRLVFSFTGLVVASIIYSLPFMVQPLLAGFRSLPNNLKDAAYTLGKSPRTTLFQVLLPNIKGSILSGIILTFAHTLGEFGVVLMIGGSIPGQTRVASIAIYDEVESMNYASANVYALTLFALTFLILLIVYSTNYRLLRASKFP
jgi:molybdate transport system permease protein